MAAQVRLSHLCLVAILCLAPSLLLVEVLAVTMESGHLLALTEDQEAALLATHQVRVVLGIRLHQGPPLQYQERH